MSPRAGNDRVEAPARGWAGDGRRAERHPRPMSKIEAGRLDVEGSASLVHIVSESRGRSCACARTRRAPRARSPFATPIPREGISIDAYRPPRRSEPARQ